MWDQRLDGGSSLRARDRIGIQESIFWSKDQFRDSRIKNFITVSIFRWKISMNWKEWKEKIELIINPWNLFWSSHQDGLFFSNLLSGVLNPLLTSQSRACVYGRVRSLGSELRFLISFMSRIHLRSFRDIPVKYISWSPFLHTLLADVWRKQISLEGGGAVVLMRSFDNSRVRRHLGVE